MCCGTHVTNLCQLQVVKLLQSEKSKRKNQVLLYFLVGNRVLQKLQNCFNRELKLTVLLKYFSSINPCLNNLKLTFQEQSCTTYRTGG